MARAGHSISIPLWLKNWGNWTSGAVIQNTNSDIAEISINFYNTTGNLENSETKIIGTNGLEVIFGYPSNNNSFYGSAVIMANKPVVVMFNHLLASSNGDGLMSHIEPHR